MTFIVTIRHVQLPKETDIVVETERRLTERSEPHNRHGNQSALVSVSIYTSTTSINDKHQVATCNCNLWPNG